MPHEQKKVYVVFFRTEYVVCLFQMAILNLYFRHMLQANGEECIACPHLYAIPRQVEADVTT